MKKMPLLFVLILSVVVFPACKSKEEKAREYREKMILEDALHRQKEGNAEAAEIAEKRAEEKRDLEKDKKSFEAMARKVILRAMDDPEGKIIHVNLDRYSLFKPNEIVPHHWVSVIGSFSYQKSSAILPRKCGVMMIQEDDGTWTPAYWWVGEKKWGTRPTEMNWETKE